MRQKSWTQLKIFIICKKWPDNALKPFAYVRAFE